MTAGDRTSLSGKPLSSPRHPGPILVYFPTDNHIPSTCSPTTHGLSYELSWKSKSREGVALMASIASHRDRFSVAGCAPNTAQMST